METLSIEKKEFIKIINVLKKNNNSYFSSESQKLEILKLNDLYFKTINILTSIILKYHNEDDWFLMKFLNLLFFENKNLYLILTINDRLYDCCPKELYKIVHIIKKYKLSEVLKLFIKNAMYKPIKANNLFEWLILNECLFTNCLRGLTILYLILIADIKLIKKSDFLKSSLDEQLLYIIKYYYYLNYLMPVIGFGLTPMIMH